jgi:hypothetical protein
MLELERRFFASDDLDRLIASSTTEMALSTLQRLFDRYGLPSKSLATWLLGPSEDLHWVAI